MTSNIPKVTFNNGLTIPIIGLGTWKSQPGEVTGAVKEAISCGYRHIDCARCYGNEAEVGDGIRAKIEDRTVKREDLFITSKLWLTKTRKELVAPTLQTQLKSLGLQYLDLFLMHWPVPLKEGDELFPRDSDGNIIYGNTDFVETWKGMEECVKKGLAKSIGVSNFNKRQLERVLNEGEIPPANNQIEIHPYFTQKKLIQFCLSKGITVTAYSPLGSPDRPMKDDNPALLKDSVVAQIAKKYNKDAGQILIRYHIENNVIVIPKSVTPSRIRSNLQVFDFNLTPSEMETLNGLNKNLRYIAFPLINGHPEYPFNDEF